MCLVALKHRLSDFSYYLLILKACEKSPQINFAVINKSPGVVNCRYQLGKREEYKLSLLQEMQGELTAATLKSLTRVLCHEDYKVLRRHSRQGLVDPRADGLGSVCLSLFCAPVSSFLFSLLLRYCFSIPAMASRSPKQKWRLMPKRPTLLQKTPFSRRILVVVFWSNFGLETNLHSVIQVSCQNPLVLTNHITEPRQSGFCWAIKINTYCVLKWRWYWVCMSCQCFLLG